MTVSKEKSLGKMLNPVFQATLVLCAVLAFNLVAAFARSAGMELEQRFPWTIAASMLLFFAAGNAIMSLMAGNMDRYWSRSILSFTALAIIAGLLAYLFSSLTMSEAGSYRWIYIVLTIGYLVFLSMITFMRKIVEFAQREEWNQPRIRSKR
jgi:cell division protein FtsW (lipid II flippase)